MYFELKLLDLGIKSMISIGVTTKDYAPSKAVGQQEHSYSFHIEGKVYAGNVNGENFYNQKISVNSTVGLGVDVCNSCIFITLNGKELGVPIKNIEIDEYYPTVSLMSSNEKVTLNCYHEPYKFNLRAYISNLKSSYASSILQQHIPAYDIHRIISDYLHYYGIFSYIGYSQTLNAFKKESGIDEIKKDKETFMKIKEIRKPNGKKSKNPDSCILKKHERQYIINDSVYM